MTCVCVYIFRTCIRDGGDPAVGQQATRAGHGLDRALGCALHEELQQQQQQQHLLPAAAARGALTLRLGEGRGEAAQDERGDGLCASRVAREEDEEVGVVG
jgi:hypothetical protein